MAAKFQLDRGGVAEMLRWAAVGAFALDQAQSIAAAAQHTTERGVAMPFEATARPTTDRAGASVTITHPAGQAVEAKHSPIAKAAASLGLDVNART